MATSPGVNPLYALSPAQVIRAQSAQWRQIIKQELADTRCATPAFLAEDMDPVTQTVTVQIALQERVRTPTGPQWWDVPAIRLVPIVIPRGGGYSVTLPLKKGDEGLLVFCDTCMDFWWKNGQATSPPAQNTGTSSGSQRQNEVRRHHVHDCGFIPGMCSQPNVLSNYSADSLQIRSDDGAAVIDVAETGVTITAPAVTVNVTGSATVTATNVDLTATTAAQITAPAVSANASSGTPLALVNDTWYQWYITNIQPFLVAKGYAGPGVPIGSETTVLKGQ